jgi:hypothetical protein
MESHVLGHWAVRVWEARAYAQVVERLSQSVTFHSGQVTVRYPRVFTVVALALVCHGMIGTNACMEASL